MKKFNWPFRFCRLDEIVAVRKHSAVSKRSVMLVSFVAGAFAYLLGLYLVRVEWDFSIRRVTIVTGIMRFKWYGVLFRNKTL